MLELLLFTILGCFSFFFLSRHADIPYQRYKEIPTQIQLFTVFIFLFNAIGFEMVYINDRIRASRTAFIRNRYRLILFFTLSAISIFVLNYLLLVTAKWLLHNPHPFHLAASGTRTLLLIWLIELIIVSLLLLNNTYRTSLDLYRKNEQLQESMLQAQYQALQSQLNPHFLFNSLNTLISEIEYNPSGAVTFTRHLSDIYRYVLHFQNIRSVTIRSELEFLDSYIYLHQVRLGNCLSVCNEIPEDYLDKQIPPLSLQLLSENVIKHNIIKPGRPMVLRLQIDTEGQYLCVSNTILPKKDVTPSGKGLENLSKRTLLSTGRNLQIQNNSETFTVKIPFCHETD